MHRRLEILVTALIFVATSSVLASPKDEAKAPAKADAPAPAKDHWLGGGDFLEVPLDASALEVNVGYPGPRVSNVCGIGIRVAGARLDQLPEALVVRSKAGGKLIAPKATAKADFQIGGWSTYVWTGTLETADGQTFKALLAKHGAPDARLAVTTISCTEAERKADPAPAP